MVSRKWKKCDCITKDGWHLVFADSGRRTLVKFGIIGGNGVAATNRLLDMVERKVTARGGFRDAHHPEFLVAYDTQSPSRSMFLEGRGESFVPGYVETARMLKANGCSKICMCCNTAHYAIDQIAGESGADFINLLEVTAKCAEQKGLRRIELWVTDGARKFDIYGHYYPIAQGKPFALLMRVG